MTMRKRDGKMEKMSGKMTYEKMAMMTAMNSNDLLVSNSIVYKIYKDPRLTDDGDDDEEDDGRDGDGAEDEGRDEYRDSIIGGDD